MRDGREGCGRKCGGGYLSFDTTISDQCQSMNLHTDYPASVAMVLRWMRIARTDMERRLAGKAEMPSVFELDPDSSLDEVIDKLNRLIRQLKGEGE